MLKLSNAKSFWYNLQLSDKKVYKEAKEVERLMKKIKRCDCRYKFLFNSLKCWYLLENCLLGKRQQRTTQLKICTLRLMRGSLLQ